MEFHLEALAEGVSSTVVQLSQCDLERCRRYTAHELQGLLCPLGIFLLQRGYDFLDSVVTKASVQRV